MILIDNGHGVNTPGKCSPDRKYREYAYTRRVAAEVCRRLRKLGVECGLLTPEDRDVPLAERVRRANLTARTHPGTILVSIHSNAAGMGNEWMDARGWCVYTSPGVTRADALATSLHRAMENALTDAGYGATFTPGELQSGQRAMRKDMSDGDPDFEARLYLLTRTSCPAVLTENLFHDNRKDVTFLRSESGFDAIVRGHVDGLLAYCRANNERK